MRKFLLLSVVALVAISASAVNRQRAPKLMSSKESKAAFFTTAPYKNLAAKMESQNAFYSQQKATPNKVEFKKVNRRGDEAELELIPSYSRWTYYYDSKVLGGFIPQIMYDDASFLVANGKAYFAPFSFLDYVEGTLNESAENPYADYGAQVYTFNADVVGIATDRETGDQTVLQLEPCDVVNYTAVRSGQTTFDGYYFPEWNELYFPTTVCLGVFDAEGTDTNVYDDALVARMLDLEPQEDLNPFISKGTFNASSYYGADNDVAGDCEIFLTEDMYCVKGIGEAPYYTGAWVEFDIDENDPNAAIVFENQVLGAFNFYDDESRTTTHPGIVVTVGLLQSGGSLTAFNSPDYESTYTITDNTDETTTIANSNNTVFGEYIYAELEDNQGMFNATDMKVTITYEPAYDTSIKNVSGDKAGNSTGVSYNLMGQQVNADTKGLVIRNGKKFVNK